jgi:hypothetical protein
MEDTSNRTAMNVAPKNTIAIATLPSVIRQRIERRLNIYSRPPILSS